jgi:hypothetical protein
MLKNTVQQWLTRIITVACDAASSLPVIILIYRSFPFPIYLVGHRPLLIPLPPAAAPSRCRGPWIPRLPQQRLRSVRHRPGLPARRRRRVPRARAVPRLLRVAPLLRGVLAALLLLGVAAAAVAAAAARVLGGVVASGRGLAVGPLLSGVVLGAGAAVSVVGLVVLARGGGKIRKVIVVVAAHQFR